MAEVNLNSIREELEAYGRRRVHWYGRETHEERVAKWGSNPSVLDKLRYKVLFHDRSNAFMRFLRRWFTGSGVERLRAELCYHSKQNYVAWVFKKM